MAAEILNKLRELQERNAYPMHMPGHKRVVDFIPFDSREFDYTEIEGLDNLHHPDGIIKTAQEQMAQLTGADASFMLVNGGSSGILAAILATVKEGDEILVATNCHKSVYNALILSGAKPIYISPQTNAEGLAGGINISDIFRAFNNHDIKAVIITSPTYEGFTCDVNVIADIVHKQNAILIVDECHGAHFCFSDVFPKTALQQHADISINSWHKTLPAFNQAAIINVRSKRVSIERVARTVSMVQTTSPSYPILASMDWTRDHFSRDKNIMKTYIENLIKLRHELAHCHSLKLVSASIKGEASVADIDIGKLTIMVRCDLTGFDVAKILLEKYNIQVEYAGLHHIIAMTSPCDDEKAFKKFMKAIKDIDKQYPRKFIEKIPMISNSVETASLTPREIFYGATKDVSFEEAVGKIAAESVTAFPPDIPIVAMGQIIKQEHIDAIKRLLQHDVTILGADNEKIKIAMEA